MFLLCRLYLNRIQISKVRYKCVNFDKSRRSKIHCRSFFIFSIHFKILKFFSLSLSPSLLFFTVNFFTLKLRNLFFFSSQERKTRKRQNYEAWGWSLSIPNQTKWKCILYCMLLLSLYYIQIIFSFLNNDLN